MESIGALDDTGISRFAAGVEEPVIDRRYHLPRICVLIKAAVLGRIGILAVGNSISFERLFRTAFFLPLIIKDLSGFFLFIDRSLIIIRAGRDQDLTEIDDLGLFSSSGTDDIGNIVGCLVGVFKDRLVAGLSGRVKCPGSQIGVDVAKPGKGLVLGQGLILGILAIDFFSAGQSQIGEGLFIRYLIVKSVCICLALSNGNSLAAAVFGGGTVFT